METNTLKEQALLDGLQKLFPGLSSRVQRQMRVIVEVPSKEQVPSILLHLKSTLGYTHLSHISFVDWIEDDKFEIVYILWNYQEQIQVILKTKVARLKEKILTVHHIWRQAHTYEREIYEMYGQEFEGNEDLKEFILEDWDDIPPMRKDFKTREYVKTAFFERPGREDAKDVRTAIAERSNEDIPDFAKPYSR